MEGACKELNMEVMGGHTEITQVVKQPLISLTGVGKMKKENILTTTSVKPGQDILITKWIGLEGTSVAAKEKEEELLKKFAPSFVETAKNFDQYLSVVPRGEDRQGVEYSAMHDITEGGVFGALWEMGSGSGVGLDIDLKKIPIRQETVEVCEALGLNPYIPYVQRFYDDRRRRWIRSGREAETGRIPASVVEKLLQEMNGS